MEVPDLDPFLKKDEVLEDIRFLVARVPKAQPGEDNCRIPPWSSFLEDKFKLVYKASADLVNVGT